MFKIYTNKPFCCILCLSFLSVVLFTGCPSSNEEVLPPELTVSFNVGAAGYAWNTPEGILCINVAENHRWTLGIDFLDEEEEPNVWCRASTYSGTGDKNVRLTLDPNLSEEQRSATVTVSLDATSHTVQLQLKQQGLSQSGGTTTPPDLSALELPKIVDTTWTLYYSKGEFTLEYSPEKKHSKWVAWKLHRGYIGSSGRTDAWQWDPRILPQFRPARDDFYGYDRGHICPSADRTQSKEMNAETFMYSNMTPQIANLNQQTWLTIENKERDWVSGLDTLYICAGGTILKEADIDHYTSPSNMPVPKYNFKVILRKKASTGAYDAIGFWFENRYYGRPANASDVKTVRWIETQTGIDFFYNLPKAVQDEVETKYTLSAWGL